MKRSLVSLIFASALCSASAGPFPFSFWKLERPAPVAIGSTGSAQVLTYGSDGDTNGVFYLLGTNFGAVAWANPHTAGRLTMSSNGDNQGSDNKATIVDRAQSQYSTATVGGGGWVQADLGAGRALVLTYYSYRYRNNETTFCPTGWVFAGSNNGSSWTTIDTRSGLTSALNLWVSTSVAGQATAYRYFRLTQSGNNNSGTTHLSIGELELYGTLSW